MHELLRYIAGIKTNETVSENSIKQRLDATEFEQLQKAGLLTYTHLSQEVLCPECLSHRSPVRAVGGIYYGFCKEDGVGEFEIPEEKIRNYRFETEKFVQGLANELQLRDAPMMLGTNQHSWYLGTYVSATGSFQIYYLNAPLDKASCDFIETKTVTHAAIITTNSAHTEKAADIKKHLAIFELEQQIKPRILRNKLSIDKTPITEFADSPNLQGIYFNAGQLSYQGAKVLRTPMSGPTHAFVKALYEKMWAQEAVSHDALLEACNKASQKQSKSRTSSSFCYTKLSELRDLAGTNRAIVDEIIRPGTAPDGKSGYIMGLP
jgi:hypothetical protein